MTNKISITLEECLNLGNEERYLEYKGDVGWDDLPKRFEIIKTIIAMSNLRDGGTIVIGVNDDGKKIGLSNDNFKSYSHDKINQFLSGKINQSIDCKVTKYTENNQNFVFIQIQESKEYPVLYIGQTIFKNPKNPSYQNNIAIRKSAIYIRGTNEINSKEIETTEEWQELIERTHKKYARETIRRNIIANIDKNENLYDKELKI